MSGVEPTKPTRETRYYIGGFNGLRLSMIVGPTDTFRVPAWSPLADENGVLLYFQVSEGVYDEFLGDGEDEEPDRPAYNSYDAGDSW